MKVSELMTLIEARSLTPDVSQEGEVTCGYACDLLSWVMAHGEAGMAWVTVQTHLNVVAVASLAEMTCVVLPEGIEMEEESLSKAQAEGIDVTEALIKEMSETVTPPAHLDFRMH